MCKEFHDIRCKAPKQQKVIQKLILSLRGNNFLKESPKVFVGSKDLEKRKEF